MRVDANASKARFIRRISAVSNAIKTIDNEMICFIIYCLNCIRHGRNATYERGLSTSSSETEDIIQKELFFDLGTVLAMKIVLEHHQTPH